MNAQITQERAEQINELVEAAKMAGSVIYCTGMFDLSEQIAFTKIVSALTPFGGMQHTPAMHTADSRSAGLIRINTQCKTCFGLAVVPGKDGKEICPDCGKGG